MWCDNCVSRPDYFPVILGSYQIHHFVFNFAKIKLHSKITTFSCFVQRMTQVKFPFSIVVPVHLLALRFGLYVLASLVVRIL
jgi:hypothetical protein